MTKGRKARRILLQGTGASAGLAMGPAHRLVSQEYQISNQRVAASEVASEIRQLRRSFAASRDGIRTLRQRLKKQPEDPVDQILASHLMIVQDRELVREMVVAIKTERMNAARAVRSILRAKARYMESLPSELFRARAADIRDVERRVLGHLFGDETSGTAHFPPGSILVACEIAPSDTAAFGPQQVVAFVAERGTLASHVTIMARSRGIPVVVGVSDATETIPHGEVLIVDGERGVVIVSPTRADVAEYKERLKGERRISVMLDSSRRLPGETLDGKRIPVLANIDRPGDAAAAAHSGAEGVGLLRTEFVFMAAAGFPDEERQRRAYEIALQAFESSPVTIRTLDLGGDKCAALMGVSREANPFLGLRGIRFCLENPEIFLVQIRAILRASRQGNARILLPMVSNLEEVHRARYMLDRTAAQLREEGLSVPERVPLGIMIEVPSAVIMSDILAREVEFFSIGSNDLIQYTLAVDRGNERIAYLYNYLDPAVLRAIDQTVRSAHKHGITVGSCGEMSGETLGMLLLVGLNIDELSVAPVRVQRLKAMLSQIRFGDLEAMAHRALEVGSRGDVQRVLRDALAPYPQFQLDERGEQLLCHWRPQEPHS
ncbi:MAG: phosphoenolpyruvate--protein phosphotransferase [Candidatus Eisenbacteria sp.]|nr:phosphoenolpyruvate--protein phosphotransferase [Candidatus Eisenbacteria bacterium]